MTRRCAARGGERSLPLAFAFLWWPVRHAPGVSEPRHLFAQGLRKLRPSLDLARHASARSLAGLGSFPTAPFATASATQITQIAPAHSDGQKLPRPDETGRDPKMAARLRPASRTISARGVAYRRGRGISPARLRPVQGVRIIRETGHFCTASISQATLRRTETTGLTAKNKLV
jgi:hypothetical protein